MIKSICCIGAGYVGGPTMAVIADRCPDIQVTVVDLNADRIAAWNDADLSRLPVYEPGLDSVVGRCRGRNLHFTTAVEEAIGEADMVFISVNTPTKTRGLGAGKASDLKWVEASARTVARAAKGHTIVVEKSTLPVRTAMVIQEILAAESGKTFSVLSNPEFLAEGTAISDLERPDRVLIGGQDGQAIEDLVKVYQAWVPTERIITTNLWSSELSKLTANAFLAQRISSVNAISALCEATGADIQEVTRAIGTDSRIGSKFLKAGPGFGGSCFKKDILNLAYLCGHYGLNEAAAYWEQVVTLNDWQQDRIAKLIVDKLFGTVNGKRIGILGFAFKANTNDTRESPAIRVCKDLLEDGAQLAIYDPKVTEGQMAEILGEESWEFCDSAQQAANEADALVVLTEWGEFSSLSWPSLSNAMRKPSWVFDTRSCVNAEEVKKAGLRLWTVGAPNE